MVTIVKTRNQQAAQNAKIASDDLEIPVIEFAAPLPGFPAMRQFALVRVTEDGVLFALTSISDPDVRFLVVPPSAFFLNYEPEIDDETLAALGATDADAAHLTVLLMVTAGDTAGSSTANLMAPIILNQANRTAIQLMLGGTWPVHAPLMPV